MCIEKEIQEKMEIHPDLREFFKKVLNEIIALRRDNLNLEKDVEQKNIELIVKNACT